MGSDRMIPRYAYHKPFTVGGRRGSNQILKGALSGTQTGPRPVKALVLGGIDGA
jgi:hypothetical protein